MTVSDAYLDEAKRGRITFATSIYPPFMKNYLCSWCELEFGAKKPDFDYHNCGTSGVKQYSRRNKIINAGPGELFIDKNILNKHLTYI